MKENCLEEKREKGGKWKCEKEYHVPPVKEPLHIRVEVPGSKSITNRALLLAAMADGASELDGVLFSEDSEVFIKALKDLGFSVEAEKAKHFVRVEGIGGGIPKKKAEIFVGSAGTAARFLTAFLAMNDGEYDLDATEQMRKRPMRELLMALEELGAEFVFKEEAYHFPFRVKGIRQEMEKAEVSLNIDRSSQFLSALLLSAPFRIGSLKIHLTGKRSARSYVEMTEQMMKEFGHAGVKRLGENDYEVERGKYQPGRYEIEPDVSAACYFYAMAAVTGGSAVVSRMKRDSLQGDMKFLSVLKKMGCRVELKETEDDRESLILYGPEGGRLRGFDESFSDFSDQTMTAAAIAPFADSTVTIRGIAHIRGQESDRVSAIETELKAMKVRCETEKDRITIYPGTPVGTKVHTYHDNRVAMAFAITGLMTDGVIIEDPDCCKKTFPEYFEILEEICKEGIS
ncbi:MAG: 3-phosphoshikimate 1-carboxyvinyltransferase [Lachnospiraceae bacterium]|nr:3-phosphoshikimate 1-carboxyvinyltransferase [Lachnospiraceae bacterium]